MRIDFLRSLNNKIKIGKKNKNRRKMTVVLSPCPSDEMIVGEKAPYISVKP